MVGRYTDGCLRVATARKEVRDKFTLLALEVVSKERADAMVGLVEDLENMKDVSKITNLMNI